ncbi:hypothetical protein GCM10023079_25810 [Streptomyces chitinivorans]
MPFDRLAGGGSLSGAILKSPKKESQYSCGTTGATETQARPGPDGSREAAGRAPGEARGKNTREEAWWGPFAGRGAGPSGTAGRRERTGACADGHLPAFDR